MRTQTKGLTMKDYTFENFKDQEHIEWFKGQLALLILENRDNLMVMIDPDEYDDCCNDRSEHKAVYHVRYMSKVSPETIGRLTNDNPVEEFNHKACVDCSGSNMEPFYLIFGGEAYVIMHDECAIY